MRFPQPAVVRCRVVSVHDGDTLVTFEDRGRDHFCQDSIRLNLVTAPELNKDVGAWETTRFVEEWLELHHDGTDWPFYLETERTKRSDKEVVTLGRYVGTITSADGSVLNHDVQRFIKERGYPGGTGS